MGEQLALGVLPLALERPFNGHGAGQHGPVGGKDLTPGPAEVAHDGPDVVGVVVVGVGPQHLDDVELHEQGPVEHEHGDAEPADLAVHGLASEGPEPSSAEALSSEMRMSRASST